MKAIIYEKYGPPEVLKLEEVAKPVPNGKEVLIRVYAASVAVEDTAMRRSTGINGLRKTRKPILGSYLAGKVEAVGKDVKARAFLFYAFMMARKIGYFLLLK